MDKYYCTDYTYDPKRELVWKEVVKFLEDYIPANSSILDLGAGYCYFINNVKGQKKFAVDISTELEKYASKDVIQINSTAWDLSSIDNDSIDVVHASNLLEHLSDERLKELISEIKRVLKPRGKFIVIQPNYRYSYKTYFDDPTHVKVFDHDSLTTFLKMHSFNIVHVMKKFLPYSMKTGPSIPQTLVSLIVKVYLRSPFKPMAGQMLLIAEND